MRASILRLVLAPAVLAAAALPAAAQGSRGSDISGFNSTGSGGLVSYQPGAAASPASVVAGRVERAVAVSARMLSERLYDRALVNAAGHEIGRSEQLNVLALLSGSASPELRASLAATLSPADLALGARTVEALAGLLSPGAAGATAPSTEALTAAVAAFNALVAAAPAGFLAEPPGEFQALHVVLTQLVAAHDRGLGA